MEFNKYILVVIWSVLTIATTVKASENLAHEKFTTQSSDFGNNWVSSKVVDGCTLQRITDGCCTHTALGQKEAWWQVDLQQMSVIENVGIIYRDERALHRLAGFEIYLSNTSDWTSGEPCYKDTTANLASMSATQSVTCQGVARYVTIYSDRRVKAYTWYSDQAYLELCEVYVNGCPFGMYGYGNCNNNCTNCLGNLCDPTSGTCECEAGYHGDQCDRICPSNCRHNLCDMASGRCTECETGFHGTNCSKGCPSNCKDRMCMQEDGRCTGKKASVKDSARHNELNSGHVPVAGATNR
ncbi:cell death abnormality protein 1-like isoform X2 [Pecten maximus]|uniref:cell death abnormality protein 1-like isoform X2 n=1 Tax=Pecten maximus TaxID=6579 RepID=UPI00145810CB|nr:cell death abnormality protein 1-like isoform X2 [Pecten maximus]